MELDALQLTSWVISLLLIVTALYILLWPSSSEPCRGADRQGTRGCADAPEPFHGVADGTSFLSRIQLTIHVKVGATAMLIALITMLNSSWIELIALSAIDEVTAHKGDKRKSDNVPLSDHLITGLRYEFESREALALKAYDEAYNDPSLTKEAKALALSRIARLRFKNGHPEEALLAARFAIELGGPKPLYVYVAAEILIGQCLLAEAEERLSLVQGDSPIIEDLQTALADRRADCPVS